MTSAPPKLLPQILIPSIRLGFIILLLAGGIAAVDYFFLAPRRLPPCDSASLPAGHICMDDLTQQWGERIIWVDTRSDNEYTTNHLMFPDKRVFRIQSGNKRQQQVDAAISRLSQAHEEKACIVVFCSASCQSSTEIADYLRSLQFIEAPIFVLSGGWDALLEAGIAKD